jgi:hypothetical protein
MRATKWLQPAKPAAGVKLDAPSTPSQSTLPADRLNEIQAAVEASPSGIVVIFGRGHQVPGKSMNFSTKDRFSDGSPSWDHVAIVWKDANGNLVFAEARPINGPTGVIFFGKNSPGTARDFVTEYKDVKVVPIDLSRYGPAARDAFVNAVITATGPGSYYSAVNKNIGTICSAALQKGLDAAHEAHKPLPPAVKYLKESWYRMTTLGGNFTKVNLYTPKTAYLDATKHSVPFRFDPKAPLAKREWLVVGEVKIVVVDETERLDARTASISNSANDDGNAALAGLALGTIVTLSAEVRASQQPRPDDDQKPLPQELLKGLSDDEDDADALTDDSLQDPETDADDDEDDLEEEVNLASDPQDARTRDAPQQPDIDDDADDDDEDTPTDDRAEQPAIDDDDEEPAEEDDEEDELVDASDAEDAPADAPVMQTAQAEAGADASADDQAGPQLAASASDTADDGFSFSAFPQPAVPLEVAKEEALPAEQASPGEESSSSGSPGSEGAHPDLDSADVGNAAPSKDPVVHHGELAP